jgi:hypothetical protein
MNLSRRNSMGIAMAGALVGAVPRIADACAMCGLPPGDTAGHAYNASVLFMLAGPYFTVLAIGAVVFAMWKRAHRRPRADAATASTRR